MYVIDGARIWLYYVSVGTRTRETKLENVMTVTEIAKRAGVSIGTVDRVLHDRGRVSASTREKIRAIIEEEGFQPNPLARHLKRNRGYRIGVLIPGIEFESRYWRQIYDAIVRAAAEFSVFSIAVELFNFDRPVSSSLEASYSSLLASGCDGYIIAPVMQEETLALLVKQPPGVPYCLIDSPLPGAAPFSTIAQDPFRGGEVAGRLMELLRPAGGPFAVVRPFTEAFNLNERARGFASWFSGNGRAEVIDLVCPEKRDLEMHAILGRTLRERPDIRGFFTVSSAVHVVAEYLAANGEKEGRAVIGYDLVPENVACLRDGRIDCLISQRPEEQGRYAVRQLYRTIVLEEVPESEIPMPLDIFFKENLV